MEELILNISETGREDTKGSEYLCGSVQPEGWDLQFMAVVGMFRGHSSTKFFWSSELPTGEKHIKNSLQAKRAQTGSLLRNFRSSLNLQLAFML